MQGEDDALPYLLAVPREYVDTVPHTQQRIFGLQNAKVRAAMGSLDSCLRLTFLKWLDGQGRVEKSRIGQLGLVQTTRRTRFLPATAARWEVRKREPSVVFDDVVMVCV